MDNEKTITPDEFRAEMKRIEDTTNEVLAAIKTKVDGLRTSVDSVEELDLKKQSTEFKAFMERTTQALDRIDEMEAKLRSTAIVSDEQKANEVCREEKKIINHFMRYGNLDVQGVSDVKARGFSMEGNELKVSSVMDDVDAGYLRRQPSIAAGIIKHLTETSPVRQVAKVISSDAEVKVNRRDTAATATARAESGTMGTTNAEYGQVVLNAHEMAAEFQAYYWMLEDAAYDLEAEARAEAGEAFGHKEGTWFISGSGIGEARGIMTDVSAGIISHTAQGETTTLTNGLVLVQLPYKIADQYSKGDCYYMMRRATLGTIRAMVAGDGHFLMAPMREKGERILEGYPILTAPDMAEVGAGTFPVLFGNFGKGYTILDRLNMWMLRDPYTNSSAGYVSFKFRRRVGGIVVQPNAFHALEIAAS